MIYFYKVEESEQAASAEERLMKEWADNCEFKCAICQEVVFSNIKFNLHVVRKHKLKNIKEYRKKLFINKLPPDHIYFLLFLFRLSLSF